MAAIGTKKQLGGELNLARAVHENKSTAVSAERFFK